MHPFTGQLIPIFAADFVVGDYGTCAVMGVPGHDDRDELFAEEHHLSVTTVNESLNDQIILINSGKVCKVKILISVISHYDCEYNIHLRLQNNYFALEILSKQVPKVTIKFPLCTAIDSF